MDALFKRLRAEGISVALDCPLAQYSSFRVGGNARLAAFPDSLEKLLTTLSLARESGVRYEVFGRASNVVFSDRGFDGLIIFTGSCRSVERNGSTLCADCGAPLASLATFACENALTGAEFLHGIPGTVGGAVFMNAGAYGGSVADICIRSEWWDRITGERGSFVGAEHAFDTRMSIYQREARYLLLGAEFLLTDGDRTAIRATMRDLSERRRSSQPLEYPSAGSVFKRPVGHYAGKLIEDCGLKGTTVGGAQVSEKHAGFIINVGGATAQDIRELTDLVRERVHRMTGVELECEIRFIE